MYSNAKYRGRGRGSRKPAPVPIPIPMSAIRHHLSNYSTAAGSTISSSSTATEFTVRVPKKVTCPYNNSHIISENIIFSHMEKCRRNYEDAKISKGMTIIEVTCKYNRNHSVLPPELEMHQETCRDRETNKTIPFYMRGDDETPVSQEEKDRVYEGFHIDKYFGGTIPSADPIPFEEAALIASRKGELGVRGRGMASIRKKTLTPLPTSSQRSVASELGDNTSLLEWEETSSNYMSAAASTVTVPFDGKERNSESVEETEPEGFWRAGRAPPYNYIEDAFNPTCLSTNGYPPGLNKKERLLFDAWRRQWIQNIMMFEAEKAEKQRFGQTLAGKRR